MSDEVYSDISFVKPKSILDIDDSHILINSFSKTYAMTGWRIGYAVVNKELAGKLSRLHQLTLTNVPVFIQQAALKALELRQETAEKMKEIYRRRASLTDRILSKTKLKFTKPDAPFYFFPKLDNLDSERFAFRLLDKGVSITPGTGFGPYREYFRIALTIPDKDIEPALARICEELK
jgi:aspartate aminotransferase